MSTLDDYSEPHFKTFAKVLESAISKYDSEDEKVIVDRQKKQVESLVGLENKFRKALIGHAYGAAAYRNFVRFICEEKKNILAARPFFRERQDVFTAHISQAIKKRKEKELYKFHFNYTFILFVLRARKWGVSSPITKIANEIHRVREELIEMNMPLAINRARIFWSRTPKSHLSYMDLVQIASEGLMSAIDKFCLPYTPVFRSVAIGRMVGNFIEHYSETMLHFYPVDKRKIYRANKVVHKHGDNVDYARLADTVNEGVNPEHKTNAAEIADLLSAASCVSGNTETKTASDTAGDELIDMYINHDDPTPEDMVAKADAYSQMYRAMGHLSLFEMKLLRLKGISVESL